MSLYPGMGCEDQLRSQVNLLTEALRLERERNRAAIAELVGVAKVALDEMCNTAAPRNSFTDAVDRLDAAITKHTTTTKEGN